MKKTFLTGSILLVCLLAASNAFGLRIGNQLISVGYLKHEVLLVVGAPDAKEVIGYIDRVVSDERIRVMIIEEWIISVKTHGTTYFYSLVFEGNELKEIKAAGKK